jgi:hypothetical protein
VKVFPKAAALVATLAMVWSGVARAQQSSEEVERCLKSFEQGQIAERRGKLRFARELLAECLRTECPGAVQNECAPLFKDVTQRIPTVLPACASTTKSIGSRGVLKIDGTAVEFSGRAIELDPGEHEFSVSGKRGVESIKRAVVESKRAQAIDFTCADVEPKRSFLVPGILLGVSAVGAVSFAGFGIDGLTRRGNLNDCRGRCASEPVDIAERSFLIADISLGVSVLALGAAAFVWFLAPKPRTTAGVPSLEF